MLTLSKQDAPLPPYPTTKGQEEGSMEAPRPSLPRNYSHLTSIHMLRSGALGQYGGTPPSMDTTVCGATIPVPLPPQFSYNAYVPQSCQKGRISDVSSNSIVSCSAYCLQSIIGLRTTFRWLAAHRMDTTVCAFTIPVPFPLPFRTCVFPRGVTMLNFERFDVAN